MSLQDKMSFQCNSFKSSLTSSRLLQSTKSLKILYPQKLKNKMLLYDKGYKTHSISKERYVVMLWKMVTRGDANGANKTLKEAVDEIKKCKEERRLGSSISTFPRAPSADCSAWRPVRLQKHPENSFSAQ